MMKRYTGVVNWGAAYGTMSNRFGPLPAVCTPAETYSFEAVIGRAASVSAALRAAEVKAGEPVATFLPNVAHAVWASIGVTLSGAAETSLNPGLSVIELSHCLDLLNIRLVIADAHTAGAVRATGREPLLVEQIDCRPTTLGHVSPIDEDAWGKILFTSGTTGKPKAIVHSHKGRWLANLMLRSSLPFQPQPESRILLMTPFSHGASLLAGAFLESGASIYLMDGVQIDQVRDLLQTGEVDCMFAPPTVLAKLTAASDGFSCRTLRTIFSGTATLSPSLYKRVQKMFGPIVRVTYGKTEIFNPITVLQPRDCAVAYAAQENDSGTNLGWPVSGVEIEIRDDNDKPCCAGIPGRVFLRAPHMMIGYVDNEGRHEVSPRDWHESGDIGMLTARGELNLVGRDNDVIKTGGYKVYPQEIEAPLDAADLANEIVAVGVPSEYWGQFVVVVAERPTEGWEDRAAQVANTLSRHKRPRAYIAVSELPRNAQGKLQRSKVLESLLQQYRVEDGPRPELRPM